MLDSLPILSSTLDEDVQAVLSKGILASVENWPLRSARRCPTLYL